MQIEQVLLAEDLDRNGLVDFRDVDIFTYNWLEMAGTGLVGHWKFDEGSGQIALRMACACQAGMGPPRTRWDHAKRSPVDRKIFLGTMK